MQSKHNFGRRVRRWATKGATRRAWAMLDRNRGLEASISEAVSDGELRGDAIKSLARERLAAILTHAVTTVPHYRSVAGKVLPEVGRDPLNSLRHFPILSKQVIRDVGVGLRSRCAPGGRLIEASTGGSTGMPMRFVRDQRCNNLRRGQELFFDGKVGIEPGDRVALFVAASHFESVAASIIETMRNWTLDRMLRFDPHQITDEYMENFYNSLIKFEPEIVKCFPNSLVIFAEFIERTGRTVKPVDAVTCTGENLYGQQRRLFQRVFQCDVFEKYGTKECGVIACECKQHDGLHIWEPGVFVEILDERDNSVSPGCVGRIVVTDLYNFAMPLIRYEIGDLAQAGDDNHSCGCGSSLRKIRRIIGRDRDIILDSEGNPKPGYLFVEAINQFSPNMQFQVEQTDRHTVVVRTSSTDWPDDLRKDIALEFAKILGTKVSLCFESGVVLCRDPSGKYRYVSSRIGKFSGLQRD